MSRNVLAAAEGSRSAAESSQESAAAVTAGVETMALGAGAAAATDDVAANAARLQDLAAVHKQLLNFVHHEPFKTAVVSNDSTRRSSIRGNEAAPQEELGLELSRMVFADERKVDVYLEEYRPIADGGSSAKSAELRALILGHRSRVLEKCADLRYTLDELGIKYPWRLDTVVRTPDGVLPLVDYEVKIGIALPTHPDLMFVIISPSYFPTEPAAGAGAGATGMARGSAEVTAAAVAADVATDAPAGTEPRASQKGFIMQPISIDDFFRFVFLNQLARYMLVSARHFLPCLRTAEDVAAYVVFVKKLAQLQSPGRFDMYTFTEMSTHVSQRYTLEDLEPYLAPEDVIVGAGGAIDWPTTIGNVTPDVRGKVVGRLESARASLLQDVVRKYGKGPQLTPPAAGREFVAAAITKMMTDRFIDTTASTAATLLDDSDADVIALRDVLGRIAARRA